jgi:ubiquinone/menaquinone biosynthesis C-methylase UbiE
MPALLLMSSIMSVLKRAFLLLPRAIAMLILATIGALVLILFRRWLDDVRASMRTSSTPGVRVYELMAGGVLGGLYRDIAEDALTALDEVDAPEVLEIGHGPGHLAGRLLAGRSDLRWTGLDVDAAMVAAAEGRVARLGYDHRTRHIEGDVAAMPFDDASFDLVVSSLSAHHWPDPGAGFREIRRVLRPGGTALVFDLPATWGHAETGSAGIQAASPVFDDVIRTRFRGIGPVAIVWRVALRKP